MTEPAKEPQDLVAMLDSIEQYCDSAIDDLREIDRLVEHRRAELERYRVKLAKRCEKIADTVADIRGLVEIIQGLTVVSLTEKQPDDDDTLDLPAVPQM